MEMFPGLVSADNWGQALAGITFIRLAGSGASQAPSGRSVHSHIQRHLTALRSPHLFLNCLCNGILCLNHPWAKPHETTQNTNVEKMKKHITNFHNYQQTRPGVQQCQAQGQVFCPWLGLIYRTELGCVRLTNQNFWLDGSRASFLVPSYSLSKSLKSQIQKLSSFSGH